MTETASIPAEAAHRYSRRELIAAAALIALYLLVYIVQLDHRPLFSPDEVRYAEIPREMIASGDWVVPRLNGLRYFEKPPMGYWANALAIKAFGENGFGVRLTSALCAGLTALLVFFVTTAACRRAIVGLLGAAIYLTFAEVYIVGTFNILDGLLNLWITAGIIAFHRAVVSLDNGRGRWWGALSGAMLGFAFLTKGFLGFVIPGLVMLPWLIWSRRLGVGLARTVPCAVAALVVALPWAIAIHVQEGDFWRYFFWEEHVRRFMADNAQHKQDSLYFIRLLPLLALPWIFLIPASISGLRDTAQGQVPKETQRLLVLWCLLPFAFFSIASGKLITYILPCFPPFAALTAIGLWSYLQSGRRKLFDYCQWLLVAVFGIALITLLSAQNTDLLQPFFSPAEAARASVLGVSLALSTILGIAAVYSHLPGKKLMLSALSMVSLMAVTQFAMPNRIIERKAPGLLLSPLAEEIPEDAILISNSGTLRAASWYFKRDDILLISSAGEGTYGLGYADAKGRLLDAAMFRKLLEDNLTRRDIVIVCKRSCGDAYESMLPANTRRLESSVYRVWHLPKG